MEFVTQALALLQQGFDTTNTIQGLILAILAAWTMRAVRQIILIALFTTFIHELINTGQRIFGGVANPLPNLLDVEGDLRLIGIRFTGFVVTILLLYLLKRVVLRR